MKHKTLFEKFDQLAETPNAVNKMRELILQFAAHGKLVEQSSDDEPASALVGRIEKHIEELRGRNEFRGPPVEPLDREELPEIPSSWEWVRLGNVVDYGSSDKAESADIPEDAWLLDLEDIEKDTSRLLRRKTFRDSPSKSTKTAFAVGDVLYGKLRPYLNKVIVADARGYCTTEIIPIRAYGFIDPAYLCHTLKRPEFIAYANSKSYGMNLPRLGTQDARSAPFPLPPLAEQHRIVAKVDELMALCDRLQAQQQEREIRGGELARAAVVRFTNKSSPANLSFLFHESYDICPDDLRKSILTLAIQGKLVSQDPTAEPPEEQSSEKKSKKTEAASRDEKLFPLPDSWIWSRLRNIGIGSTGKTPPTKDPENYGGQIPFIGPGQITPAGNLLRPDKFLSEIGIENGVEALPGDVLMVCIGGSIGKSVICRERLFFNQQINSVRPISLTTEFTYIAFRSFYFQEQVAKRATGSATPIINRGKWEEIPIPVPPLAEQRRIVAKVDQLMDLVDALETQLVTSRTTAVNLLDAMVSELAMAA